MGRWCKGFKEFVFGCNARSLPLRHILTPARVGQYHGCMHIYIWPYTVPPTTLIPRSRISGLQGSQGYRVTGSPKPQSHRVTETQGYRVSKYPSSQESWGHRVTRATLSHGHWVTGSLGHWVTGLSITRVYLHGSGLQGHPGSRVT